MEEEKVGRIENQLEIIIKLLASKLLLGKSKTEAIKTLGGVGLDRVTISKIVGVKPDVVSTRLSEAKKKAKLKGISTTEK